jgi:hypothetical protein
MCTTVYTTPTLQHILAQNLNPGIALQIQKATDPSPQAQLQKALNPAKNTASQQPAALNTTGSAGTQVNMVA